MPKREIDLESVERNLRAELAELRERLAELSKPPERGSQVGFGKRVGDGTTEAVSRLTEVGVFETLTDSERRVTQALEAIEAGTYGICENCGEPIPARRLEVAPQATLCVDCAR